MLVSWLSACAAPVVECQVLWEPGTLLVEQLDLPSGATGESALVIGPDGASVLIDVGNDGHEDDVRDALARQGLERPDHVLLTHDDQDHVGGVDWLLAEGLVPVRWDTAPLPTVLELGGASLTVFLADGRLATDQGVVALDVDLQGLDNARSLGGIVSWGDFDYVFAGDLTGGGKGTPDVEGAVAARADQIEWVAAGTVEAVHVNHHGISSSTSAAWADWLRPVVAVVGANDLYLDAPSPEALGALAPWVDAVWVTEDGRLGNRDAHTTVAHGPVAISVEPDGRYQVCGTTRLAAGASTLLR